MRTWRNLSSDVRNTAAEYSVDNCCPAAASSSAADLASAPSVGALAEAASAAQDRDARQVLGIAEPGDSLPVPHGWRSSGLASKARPTIPDASAPSRPLWASTERSKEVDTVIFTLR